MKKILFSFILFFIFCFGSPLILKASPVPCSLNLKIYNTFTDFFNYYNSSNAPFRDLNSNILSSTNIDKFYNSLYQVLNYTQTNKPAWADYYAVVPLFTDSKISAPFSSSINYTFQVIYFEDLETIDDIYIDIANYHTVDYNYFKTYYAKATENEYKDTQVLTFNYITSNFSSPINYSSSSNYYITPIQNNKMFFWQYTNYQQPLLSQYKSFDRYNEIPYIKEMFIYNNFPDIIKEKLLLQFNSLIYNSPFGTASSPYCDTIVYNNNNYHTGDIIDINSVSVNLTNYFAVLIVPKNFTRYQFFGKPFFIDFYYKGEISLAWYNISDNDLSSVLHASVINPKIDFNQWQYLNISMKAIGGTNQNWFYDDYIRQNNKIVGTLIYNNSYQNDSIFESTFISYDSRYYNIYLYDDPSINYQELEYTDFENISHTNIINHTLPKNDISSKYITQTENNSIFNTLKDFINNQTDSFNNITSYVIIFYNSFSNDIKLLFSIIFILGLLLTIKRWFFK